MKRPSKLLTRGLITGLIGATTVALWFFFLDFSDGHPFRTPAALGSALLFGVPRAAAMEVSLGVVAAYTLVHVIAFVVAGTIFVWIAEQIERASPSSDNGNMRDRAEAVECRLALRENGAGRVGVGRLVSN